MAARNLRIVAVHSAPPRRRRPDHGPTLVGWAWVLYALGMLTGTWWLVS